MNNSTEVIYNILKKYLFPLLKFANIYVDDYGILRPVGRDPTLSYQEDGRELIIIDTQAKYMEIKAKKEEYQIFNPFSIPKQCVFLANMVMMAANEKDTENDKTDEMEYDEDLDMYIPKDESIELTNTGSIKMFESRDPNYRVNSKITFAHTDKSGNPIDEFASFSHVNIMMATIGAIINLIKRFQTTISPDIISTHTTIMNIEKELHKLQILREKEKKEKPVKIEINRIEDEEVLYDEINECEQAGYFIDVYLSSDSFFFPNDKRIQYDPRVATSKINRNIILPNFKTLEEQEEIAQTFSDMSDLNQYTDIDFEL